MFDCALVLLLFWYHNENLHIPKCEVIRRILRDSHAPTWRCNYKLAKTNARIVHKICYNSNKVIVNNWVFPISIRILILIINLFHDVKNDRSK